MFREQDIHLYDEYLIQLREVVKAYKTEAGEFLALKDVNLLIGEGEFVGIIGKSGSGKSTLINMISGIDRPTSGGINIRGEPIHTFDESTMSKWRGRNLGIVFQFFQLLPILTVIENVMLPMDFCQMYNRSKRYQRAMELLDMVDVADHANKLPGQLSGGEQQRVAIARALANDPPIILADEPTGNLDSKTSERIFSVFESFINGGKTMIMVTHDSDQAKRVSRTIIISDGEIIEEYLLRTFPSLTHEQSIWITSQLQHQRYKPGSIIIQKGEPINSLFIVKKGSVEIVSQNVDGHENIIGGFERGQYFGESGLMNGRVCQVTVRAAGNITVELAILNLDAFNRLINESNTTKQEIQATVQDRVNKGLDLTNESNRT